MKVLLIAPDSKIPNLAIMKYSTYWKRKGAVVGFGVGDPDLIIGSIIFEENRGLPEVWKMFYPGIKIVVGGPGYDPSIRLPEEVERSEPDRTIYPEYSGSVGRVTIGCIRKCYFCKVPEFGPIRYVQHVSEFARGEFVRILDDNLFAHKRAWRETVEYLKETGKEAYFDGLDIRLMNDEIARDLASINFGHHLHFAFDSKGYEKELRRGIEFLDNHGIRGQRLMFYVYVHSEPHIESAKYRWDVLRELNVDGYIMVNQNNMTHRLRRIKRRGTRPAIWRGLTTEEVFA